MSAQELKERMSEKLKYVLSGKDSYDCYEGHNKLRMSKKIIIPSKFTALDKIHRYGGKIEDPFLVNLENKHEMENRVFTAAEHQKLESKRVAGIKQIQDTFDKAKTIQVGMTKPGSHGKVTAKRVFEVQPLLTALPHKIIHVINDDSAALTENLTPGTTKEEIAKLKKLHGSNNGQILVNYLDQLDNDKKFALYRWDAEQTLPEDVAKVTLGKRAAPDGLNSTTQLEHVRNYCFSQHQNDSRDEYVLHIDPATKTATYMPISTKLALLKKKRMQLLSQEDEDKLAKHQQTLTPGYMMLAPRSLTGIEAKKQQKSLDDANAKLVIDPKKATLQDRKQIVEI